MFESLKLGERGVYRASPKYYAEHTQFYCYDT